MPIVPCFDPTTGASGGAQGGGGGGGMPAWQQIMAVDFRTQTPAIVGNGSSFSVVDTLGRTITGSINALVSAGLPGDVEAGWDATNGFYTKIAATTNNTVYKVAVPLEFPGGVVMGLYDDVFVKYYGRVNMPATNNRAYWCSLRKPLGAGTQYETDGAICIHFLRLTAAVANLRFDFDGGQSPNMSTNPQGENPGVTLDVLNGTQDVEFESNQPRWHDRGKSTLIVPGISRTYVAYGGSRNASPRFSAETSATVATILPQTWNGKNKLMISNTIYNGGANGGGNQISSIHKIEIYRRELTI